MGKKAERVPPVTLGQTIELLVERLGYRGEGVGRVEGFTVFVEGALPGERVNVRITSVARSYAHAFLLEVVESAPERVQPPCPVFALCGGCQLQHMTYAAQLQWKRQTIIDALVRIGKFAEDTVLSIVQETSGMGEPWRYRNKVQVAAAARGGRFVAGFVEEGTHEPVESPECLIRPESHDSLLAVTLHAMDELGIEPYDEANDEGDVRGVMIRTSQGGDALITITTATARLPHSSELSRRLATGVADSTGFGSAVRVVGVVQVIDRPMTLQQTGKPSIGSEGGISSRVLWGVPYVEEIIRGLRYRVSAQSFLQVNPVQTDKLYEVALNAAHIESDDVVWDIYSGIGTIALLAAQRAKKVIGVEEMQAAVQDAEVNAEKNGVTNAEFIAGRAERVILGLLEGGSAPDIVLLDPPRAGCAPEVLAVIGKARPSRVIYLSCNPATLARDLRILADQGYSVSSVQPVDMFPQTAHVECVVLLVRNS